MRLKAKSIFTVILLVITIFTLTGCKNNETYVARFIDWDDTLIEEVTVESSAFEDIRDLPDDPTREGYTFDKWISSYDSVLKVIIAKATYTINTYTIVWKNHDGSVLAINSNVEWGSTPSYVGATPIKAATAEFNYTFIGWSPTVAVATSNQEYVAHFSETIKIYTVIWKNYDGTVLETDTNVAYGATPSYDGKTPTKPSDSQYSYSFNGWSPEVSSVEANKTYTAQFTQSGRLCTVYFNLNGGSSPSYSSSKQISAIEKENFFFNVEKVGYNFRGWVYKGTKVFDEYGNIVGNVQLVSGMTFDALFVDKVKLTIVKNIEEAGNVIGSGEYAFNSEVDIKVIPNDGYEFIGWYYNEDVLSHQTTYKYKMWDKDLIIEARFQVASYKLQIDSNNSDKGIVAIDPSGIFSALEYSASTNKSIKWKQSVKIAAYSKTEQTRFLGWYDDEGNLVSTNAVYEFEMPYSDINYHAKWNCFSISYTMNGGTNNKSNPTIYDVDSGNIELLTPTKSGATFVAWYCDGKIITSIDTSKKSNITVEAVWSNTYYTVKYSLDGGKSYTTVNYSPADGYTLTNPTKTGYTFTGWTGSNGTTPQKNIVIKSKEIGNRTYVANWQISTYSITYSLNGGNLSNKVTSYTVEDQNIQLATPTRDYYNFSKWQIDGKDVTYISTSLAKNVTVVALWTPIDYTITYNLDGGTASNATKYNVETSTFTLTNPTRTGYKFIGWTGSNGSTPQMNVSIAKGGHTNLTYKANWEVNNYSISYVLNGGKNNANNKTTYNINSGTISLYNPTRDYYNFKEWQLNGQKVTSISSSSTLKDITLTAIWTPIGYTITYDLDGGTASNVTKYNIETSTFTLTNPTKTGYTFTGWTGSNGSTPQTSVSISKGSHDNLSYTANWQINQYTLTFNTNGGSEVSDITEEYGKEISVSTIKEGYSFVGWHKDSSLSLASYYELGSTMPAENLTLYAKWQLITHSITYVMNEYTTNDASNPATYNFTSNISLIDPSVIEGTFIGWFTDENYTNEIENISNMTGNITLYAKVEMNQYTMTFVTNGGSEVSDITEEYGKEISVSTTKEGYMFEAWCSDEGLTTSIDISKMPNANLTVYAKWTINSYTLELTRNNTLAGSVTGSGIKEYNNEVTITADTNPGYTFIGWYNGEDLISTLATYTFNMPATNLNYEAKWQVNQYTMTFVTNGGTEISPITQDYGTAIHVSTTKEGYMFEAWCSDEGLTTSIDISKMPNANLTVYAKWAQMYEYFTIDNMTYVYYGTYPQTVVSDSALISSLNSLTSTNANGYYEFEGEEYAKVVADPRDTGYKFINGSTIQYGQTYYFKVEPIKWRVLEDADGTYTLLSDYIIDKQAFYPSTSNRTIGGQTIYANNYKHSTIREWLNNAFYNKAFSSPEKGSILTTLVDNSASTTDSSTNPYISNNTMDKVYLLSYQEARSSIYGFSTSTSSYSTRTAVTTDYARAVGAYMSTFTGYYGNGFWWLRSPIYDGSNIANLVSIDGFISYSNVDDTNYGARPAIKIG